MTSATIDLTIASFNKVSPYSPAVQCGPPDRPRALQTTRDDNVQNNTGPLGGPLVMPGLLAVKIHTMLGYCQVKRHTGTAGSLVGLSLKRVDLTFQKKLLLSLFQCWLNSIAYTSVSDIKISITYRSTVFQLSSINVLSNSLSSVLSTLFIFYDTVQHELQTRVEWNLQPPPRVNTNNRIPQNNFPASVTAF